mmetsp:Transcript_15036/g.31852  ORF Transcript_15036/g.31852 Transcript_15036/m.31852 type:complete len:217 (+) Transcript_15036:733-1383(+)
MTSLTCALVLTSLALDANCSVERVSSKYNSEGVAQQMTAMRAFPERDGCKILVNLESRKLMCLFFSPRLDMTRESVSRLWLIFPPSFCRSPVAPVCRTLSDPAKSTKLRVETLTAPSSSLDKDIRASPSASKSLPSPSSSSSSSSSRRVLFLRLSTVIRKMVWDLELLSFIPVAATLLFFSPANKTLKRLSNPVTIVSLELTNTPLLGSSRIVKVL